MPDLLGELTRLGHVARVVTLRRGGFNESELRAALASGAITRPRHGWVASPLADRDQLEAIAIGGRIACSSALRRFGVWSGVDDALHVQVPPTASRVAAISSSNIGPGGALHAGFRAGPSTGSGHAGVWHPSVHALRHRGRSIRLASDALPRVHWSHDVAPQRAFDWIVSLETALATAVRCLDAEHARAAIDSVVHERLLSLREVERLLASLRRHGAGLVDRFTGRPESGVESLFVRRMSGAGYHVDSQFRLAEFGRYDGIIDGCVLFEIDGRGFHSGPEEFFADRDRTLVGPAFGVPVVRPSARHVLEEWPMTFAAVARTVADAGIVRRERGLPPIGA